MKSSCLLLAYVLPSVCFAQTTVSYTLSGTYIAQLSGTRESSWSKTGICIDKSSHIHAAQGGGNLAYTRAIYGTVTFSGTGGTGTISGSLTTGSVFDQNKSDATVQITWSTDGNCEPTISDGYAVFDPPTAASATGSYKINTATGTGTLSIVLGGEGGVTQFLTTGSFASCAASGGTIYVVPNTILVQAYSQNTPNKISFTGTAEHQNGILMACPPPAS